MQEKMIKQAEPVGFWRAIKNFFGYYATFRGRSSRSEYWWSQLAIILASTVIVITFLTVVAVLDLNLSSNSPNFVLLLFVAGGVIAVASAGLITPNLAITARRLRDAGLSPWFVLLWPVPGGQLALLIMMILPPQEPPSVSTWSI